MALADAVAFAVAAWNLDEASGTRADQVGANDLTDNNTVGSTTGKFNNAADFERDNQEYLSRADNADLSTGDIDFCLSCWVNLETAADVYQGIIAKADDGGNQREFRLRIDGGVFRFQWSVSSDGTAWTDLTASGFGQPATSQWYLLVVKHDATNNVIGISVNGGAYAEAAHSTGVFNSTASFFIGRNDAGGSDYLDGLLDDVVFLKSYILDSSELSELYNGGTGKSFAEWSLGVQTLGKIIIPRVRPAIFMPGIGR